MSVINNTTWEAGTEAEAAEIVKFFAIPLEISKPDLLALFRVHALGLAVLGNGLVQNLSTKAGALRV